MALNSQLEMDLRKVTHAQEAYKLNMPIHTMA